MVVLLLFIVPEGVFSWFCCANYSGDRRPIYCTKVGSRRQKRFRSLYFRAQSVTSVTETIAVRKYSIQRGDLDQEGIMPLLSHPHERTNLKHHYGLILARSFRGFCLSLAK